MVGSGEGEVDGGPTTASESDAGLGGEVALEHEFLREVSRMSRRLGRNRRVANYARHFPQYSRMIVGSRSPHTVQ